MDDKQVEMIRQITQVFMRYGIRSVNMDDIARELKISKKTLYKYFKDKNDVVSTAMKARCLLEQSIVKQFLGESENAIDELMLITKFVGEELQDVHPSVVFDIQKYYPEAWGIINEHKTVFIKNSIVQNLERGISEGLYRKNLNVDIISAIYENHMEAVLGSNDVITGKITMQQVHLEVMRYHIRGIANEKGIEYLKEKIKTEHSNL